MKLYLAIFISLFLVCCKVTKQKQSTSIPNPPKQTVVKEKQEQVFIPADALEMSVPPPNSDKGAPPPPPPPPPRSENEEVFKVVEEMPRFPGCEEMEGGNNEKSKCANDKMLEYTYSNLVYPQSAIESETEGMCVIQFIVLTDGSIEDIKIVRDIGSGCGQAAADLVNSMNTMDEKWVIGKQRGRPVQVLYTFPVRFVLSEIGDKYKRDN